MSQAPPTVPPVIASPDEAPVPIGADGNLTADRACVRCGYNLRGLPRAGVCPECSTPVADSLRTKVLKYSSPEYLAKLHRGVFLVQTAIIIQILMGFAVFGAAIALKGALAQLQWIAGFVGLLIAAMSLYGWWLFSELDPGYTGQDQGTTPRKVIRLAVIAGGAAALLSVLADLLSPSASATPGAAPVSVMHMVAGVVSIGAGAVQYFASMLYLQWLAKRVPNEKAGKRAKNLMWLGPVLLTVGIILIGLGPIIALVLYWNLLDWFRKDLKRIRGEQVDAPARA